MEVIKKMIDFVTTLSIIQKVFVLILLFNHGSGGDWVYLMQNEEGTSFSGRRTDIAFGLDLVCIIGFFLFWKVKK